VKDNAIVSAIEVTPFAAGIKWKEIADAPQQKFESMGDVVNGKLYVIGGYFNASIKTTAQVASYDPANDKWTTLSDMPEKLTHSGTTSDGNFIYLAGGYIGDWQGVATPVTRHVWRYDTSTDAWTSMLSLPANRAAGALVRVGRKLHFFGGLDSRKRDKGEHWVLDLRKPTKWTSADAMPNPRNHLGAIETGGKIYAIGGQHDLDEDTGNDSAVNAYDVVTGKWSAVKSLPRVTSHTHNSTFAMGGKVVIVGGSTAASTALSQVMEYDPSSNKWRQLGDLPVPLSACVADLLNGHIIVTGGTTSGSQPRALTWINV
jgi:N-acetylneuraminic acid mutarotase